LSIQQAPKVFLAPSHLRPGKCPAGCGADIVGWDLFLEWAILNEPIFACAQRQIRDYSLTPEEAVQYAAYLLWRELSDLKANLISGINSGVIPPIPIVAVPSADYAAGKKV
jgi:hypothetical protein